MKLETFFEKFDQFADAPDAVAKMRELILLLALEGRIGDTDAATWERVQLGDLGEWGSGGTPLSTESRYYDGNIPWLIIGDLNDGVVTSSMKTITEEGLANSSARMVPKNVLLIAMYGSIGKLGITGIECATNQAIAFCKPDLDRADLRYLFHAFMGLRPKFLSRGQGLAQKNISQRILRAWEIGLPPLAEQKRIVTKVDELMALCDRLALQQQERETRHAALARASLARFADAPTPANLNLIFHSSYSIPPADLRKSILTLAVQGKLVPQDPNDEPAEELLARLASELSPEHRRNQAAPLAPLPAEALQYELPESWKWARFRDAAIIASNLVKPDDFLDFTHLAPDNIEKANGVLLPCRTVREDKVISSNHRFYHGQIVYSKIRPNLAKVVVVDFEGLCSADMYPIDALIDPFYLQRYMLSDSFLVQAVKTDTRVAMPKINQMELNAIAVPVPPLAEQRRIVAKAEQLMALVDALETQLAASRATAANLLSALVAELTGTPHNGKVSVPSTSTTGRRGRPRKSA